MLADWIPLLLQNFAVAMFILAIILILLHRLIRRNVPESEIVYRWMALFALGFTGIYTFVWHIFYPERAAAIIGWAASPFQFEVGMADLAFGLVGILSFNASYGFRLATVIVATVCLWGDAIGHIYQMVQHHNFSPGNAGSWFVMDIIIPLVLILCIAKLKRVK